jgi:hypothetical protein
MVTINGVLRFDNTTNRHLRAQHIYVKAGELYIGTEEEPFPFTATITLFGEKESDHIVFTEAIEAGNKLIANTGTIKMYGIPRSSQFVRILAEVYPGNNTLTVPPNLDYRPDDILVLAPTSFDWMEDEYLKVITYDSKSGNLKVEVLSDSQRAAPTDKKLRAYHYGAPVSTAAQYNGLDIRGELLQLSRNILIKGDTTYDWGCQIVTSDFEVDGVTYPGSLMLDNV